LSEQVTYGEHRRRQREYERQTFAACSPEERQARIDLRKEYLFGAFLAYPSRAFDILDCPHCSPGFALKARGWPSWFLCLNCERVLVIDMNSHLTMDDVERLFIEPLAGLRERYERGEKWARGL
jgi:hypothetical protein